MKVNQTQQEAAAKKAFKQAATRLDSDLVDHNELSTSTLLPQNSRKQINRSQKGYQFYPLQQRNHSINEIGGVHISLQRDKHCGSKFQNLNDQLKGAQRHQFEVSSSSDGTTSRLKVPSSRPKEVNGPSMRGHGRRSSLLSQKSHEQAKGQARWVKTNHPRKTLKHVMEQRQRNKSFVTQQLSSSIVRTVDSPLKGTSTKQLHQSNTNVKIDGASAKSLKQRLRDTKKFRFSLQQSNVNWVMGDHQQNLKKKIPGLGANMAYADHKFAMEQLQSALYQNWATAVDPEANQAKSLESLLPYKAEHWKTRQSIDQGPASSTIDPTNSVASLLSNMNDSRARSSLRQQISMSITSDLLAQTASQTASGFFPRNQSQLSSIRVGSQHKSRRDRIKSQAQPFRACQMKQSQDLLGSHLCGQLANQMSDKQHHEPTLTSNKGQSNLDIHNPLDTQQSLIEVGSTILIEQNTSASRQHFRTRPHSRAQSNMLRKFSEDPSLAKDLEIASEFKSLQAQSICRPVRDSRFVRTGYKRVPLKDAKEASQPKGLVQNARVRLVKDQIERQQKSLQRDKTANSYLGRVQQRLSQKKAQIYIDAMTKFEDIKRRANEPSKSLFVRPKIKSKLDLKKLYEQAKQGLVEIKLQEKLKMIESLVGQTNQLSKEQIGALIKELDAVDVDDVYSDSDASEHRTEELEIKIDNRINDQLHKLIGGSENTKKSQSQTDPRQSTIDTSVQSIPLKRFKREPRPVKKPQTEQSERSVSPDPVSKTSGFKSDPEVAQTTQTREVSGAARHQSIAKNILILMDAEELDQESRDNKPDRRKRHSLMRLQTNFEDPLMSTFQKAEARSQGKRVSLKEGKVNELMMMLQTMTKNSSFNADQMDELIHSVKNNQTDKLKFLSQSTITDFSKKLLTQSYQKESKHLKSKLMVQRAMEIVNSFKFFEIGKEHHKETFQSVLKDDPMLVYQCIVNKSLETVLPLVSKVASGKLVLQNYTLDQGQLRGLAQALRVTQKPSINALLLNNCGIDDAELEILLQGLSTLDQFHKLFYINNVFMFKGLAALKPILLKPEPHNLVDLRLVNCDTKETVIEDLVSFIVGNSVKLRSLTLVRVKITRISITSVADLVKHSESLEDLDLSWNSLLPNDFAVLFEVLAKNRTLRRLNLSCNQIIEKKAQNNPFDLKFSSAMQEYIDRRGDAIKAGLGHISKVKVADCHVEKAIECFGKLIRYNRAIQSIVLNNTGLNAQVLAGLVPYLRHAKSLLCLHMASNPGINPEVQAYYCERLKTFPEFTLRLDIQAQQFDQVNPHQLNRLTPDEKAVRAYKTKHYREWKTEEVTRYHENNRIKPLFQNNFVELKTEARDISISRVLGHKQRMPGSGRWRIQTVQGNEQCWFCDDWLYTLYFWNEKIAEHNEMNQIGIETETMCDLVQTMRRHYPDTYMSNKKVPMLFAGVHQWKPRPFMTLLDFLDTLEPIKSPLFEKNAFTEAMKIYEFSEGDELSPEIKSFIQERKAQSEHEFVQMRLANATRIVKDNLRFKKPALINFDKIEGFHEKIWVCPIFLKPGKNEMLIRTPEDPSIAQQIDTGDFFDLLPYQLEEDAAFRFYYRRQIIDIREERVPPFAKQLKTAEHSSQFIKSISVFRDWKEDTEKTIRDAFNHDISYWKVKRLVPNYDEYNKVVELMRYHYEQLKQIFMGSVTEHGHIDFKKINFFKLCERIGIADKTLNSGIIDTYFKATNFEEFNQDQNDDNALTRFEFLEILVRIAKGKYLDTGKEKVLVKALSNIIQGHILPLRSIIVPQQDFRDNELWTIEVNDLLEINIRGIRKLYDTISCSHQTLKKNRLTDVNLTMPSIDQIRYFLTGQLVGVSEQCILQAFYLSKMTVVKETANADFEYTYLQWPEFIEFIGRLAQLRYRGTYEDNQWALTKKLVVILDQLFALISEPRLDPPELKEVISDSDDDY